MSRPFFVDEIIGAIDGDFEPRYSISEEGRLRLLNPIIVEGTPINANNMNNLFYFYNLIGVGNSKYATSGFGTKTITETIKDRTTNNLIAKNFSVGSEDNTNWIIVETLFYENGIDIMRERKITYTKIGNEWEAIIE